MNLRRQPVCVFNGGGSNIPPDDLYPAKSSASSEHDEHIEILVFNDLRHVGLLADAALHVGAQFVEDNLTGHAGDGLFAGRIDFCQDHLVEQRKTIGKILVEIAGAGVEVGW